MRSTERTAKKTPPTAIRDLVGSTPMNHATKINRSGVTMIKYRLKKSGKYWLAINPIATGKRIPTGRSRISGEDGARLERKKKLPRIRIGHPPTSDAVSVSV